MERIKLSKTEKAILRLLKSNGADALDTMPRSQVRRALRSLEAKHFVNVAWIEGGDYEAVSLQRDAKDYMIENPKLKNPLDWKKVGIVASVASAVAVVLGFILGILAGCALMTN